MLKKHFLVDEYECKLSPKYLVPFFIIKQVIYLIAKTQNSNRIIVAFGGYHSFFPALLGKMMKRKVFIIVHGTDAVSFPELNYGLYRNFFSRIFINWSYNLAFKLLPVSSSLILTTNSYFKDEPLNQGIKRFNPRFKTAFTVIPNAFDYSFWESTKEKERNRFITVSSSSNVMLKGIDLIFNIAPQFPDCLFVIVGRTGFPGISIIPENIKLYPFLTKEQLLEVFSESAFYLQLSVSEGFGCSLCEAMLSGCVPIVSNVNELPSIAGGVGWILIKRDTGLLKKLLDNAIDDPDYTLKSKAAREHIMKNYSLEVREGMLLKELQEIN
jgi:glycosyltransferase involved in cell wall biosynthesis